MLQKKSNGLYQSSLLATLGGVIHGFSTRHLGDARSATIRHQIIGRLDMNAGSLIVTKQVHGNHVVKASQKDRGSTIKNADGIVATYAHTPITLGVVVADCVPLLLVDPVARVISAVHAGWKGTLGNIASQAVTGMEELGALPYRIYASIGPHIGMCCYDVPKERAMLFKRKDEDQALVTTYYNDSWHLDLARVIVLQLLAMGVSRDTIDVSSSCTSCQSGEFFSFRKDSKESFGEILAVIGFS